MADDYDDFDEIDDYENLDEMLQDEEDEDDLVPPPPRRAARQSAPREPTPREQPMARPRGTAVIPAQREQQVTRQALDWGISGSIIAILVLTALYAFSPIDFIPDVIPVAGQADDVAAILAGGGSVVFLTALRYLLRSRVGRWGCLVGIVLAAIGGFVVFSLLIKLFGSVV